MHAHRFGLVALLAATALAGCGEVLLYPDGGNDAPAMPDASEAVDGPVDASQLPDAEELPPPDPVKSTVTASPTMGLFANNMDMSDITVTVNDADGDPIEGMVVVLMSTTGGTVTTAPMTDANGVSHATLTASTPGAKTITASAGPDPGDLTRLDQQAIVTFNPPPIDFGFTGKVTAITDANMQLPITFQVNDIIQGNYTFNSMQADTNPDMTLGVYPHLTKGYGIDVIIEMKHFNTDPDDVDFTVTITNRTGEDRYELASRKNKTTLTGLTIDTITWKLEDLTGGSLTSDDLVLNPDPALCLPPAVCPTTDWMQPQGLQIAGHNTAIPARTFVIFVALDSVF